MIRRVQLLCVLTVFSLVLTPLAHAQSANEILDASREAITEVPGLQGQFRMQGEGGSMFADTMPSMSGQLFFGTHPELGRVIRVIGEGKDRQTEPTQPIDMLLASDRAVWVDRANQQIIEAPRTNFGRGSPSFLTLVLIDSILNDDPFAKDANNAQSITLGEREEVGGVLCDRIEIKRAKPSGRSRGSADSYTDVVWWIGAQDKLPRKVDRITDAGMVKITLNFEMSNMQVSEPDEKQLDVNRPEGFAFVSRMPSDRPTPAEPPRGDDDPADRADPEPAPDPEPTTPRLPKAPSFSFTTSDGATIDNATQRGRVSVLYFWGSWCVPCRDTSPPIEQMAAQSDAPDLDVFALAIREGNPDQALSGFTGSYPTPRVSINPEGITSAFKIRVFPSIVVLDKDGSIVFQRGLARGYSPAQLVEDAREAVNGALGGS